jgi:hypothetical protein
VSEDLEFKVVRIDPAGDEVIARCVNLRVARGAFAAAAREYPRDKFELRSGAHVNARTAFDKFS